MKKTIIELNDVQVKYLQDVLGFATLHLAAYECMDREKKKVYIEFTVRVLKKLLLYPDQEVNELFVLLCGGAPIPEMEDVTEDKLINLLKGVMRYEDGQDSISHL